MEECSQNVEPCYCWRTRNTWSSDEVASDDSSIGTPISGKLDTPFLEAGEVAPPTSALVPEQSWPHHDLHDGGGDAVSIPGLPNATERRRVVIVEQVGDVDTTTVSGTADCRWPGREPTAGSTDDGSSLLSTGPTPPLRLLDNALDLQFKPPIPSPTTTVMCADPPTDHVACQGPSSEEAFHAKARCQDYGVQAAREVVQPEEDKNFHKRGNGAVEGKDEPKNNALTNDTAISKGVHFMHPSGTPEVRKDDDVAVVDLMGEKITQYHMGTNVASRELGFPNHTPSKINKASTSSPQPSKNTPSNNWMVYSRSRRCKQKLQLDPPTQPTIHTAPKIKILTRDQQTRLPEDTRGVESSGPKRHVECTQTLQRRESDSSQTEETVVQGRENEKPKNRTMEEAVMIWNMAQEIGVTSDTEQGVIIRKIKDMEERDKKKAQRLGEGRHIP